MYEAWETTYTHLIEDYQRAVDGGVCEAVKVDWISKLPKIFSFQLNRIKFIDGNAEKVNSFTNIEKEIYADRFLMQNLEESSKLRKQVHLLRDKIKHLESCLDQYKNFEGSGYDVSRALGLAQAFFEK